MSKRVQFSTNVAVKITFANEDYDRTAQEVAKLNYNDMMDLLKMKSQWRRDTEQMMTDRANREKQQEALLAQKDLDLKQQQHHQQQQSSVFTSAQEICT